METQLILYPSLVMLLMTVAMIFRLGIARYRATVNREVNMRYYRLFRDGEEPDYLRLLQRHVQNHFEIPPLLHIGALMAYVTGTVNGWTLAFAWAFVASRALHSWIHLGSNNVALRFRVFGLGVLMVAALWVSVFLGL